AEVTHVENLLVAVSGLDADRVRDVFGEVLSGGDGTTAEIALADGRTHLSVVVRRLDEDGATTGAVACFTDVTDSLRLRHELQQRAEIDPLTGSLNRSAVLERLTRAVEADGPGVAVVFVDLDGFKAVNDEQGHETGDEVLVRVADVLRQRCRDQDEVGRYGGDEFLLTCGDVGSPQEAQALAERFATALAEHDLRASVGVAWSRPGAQSVRQLVAAADTAMYAAKAARKGQVVLAS
ncbi:MAG: GGDEF domain-containing protein, partial [Mycobacteriales bacterium]